MSALRSPLFALLIAVAIGWTIGDLLHKTHIAWHEHIDQMEDCLRQATTEYAVLKCHYP